MRWGDLTGARPANPSIILRGARRDYRSLVVLGDICVVIEQATPRFVGEIPKIKSNSRLACVW